MIKTYTVECADSRSYVKNIYKNSKMYSTIYNESMSHYGKSNITEKNKAKPRFCYALNTCAFYTIFWMIVTQIKYKFCS